MSFKTSETTVGSAVATSGTITFSYPENMNAGNFAAFGHKMWVDKFQRLLVSPTDFTVSFGASNITVTYLGSTSIPVGARVNAQFNVLGADDGDLGIVPAIENVSAVALVEINLGAPDTLDADGILDGVTATDSVQAYDVDDFKAGFTGTLDVPRNLTIVGSAGANHVVTVTGTDVHGQVMVENLTVNADTPVAGKKAFKTVTTVSVAAGASGDTIDLGWGDVLGLPVFLPGAAHILKELQDGAAASAGTTVAGVSTAATATTGDVRGTYDPNAAADGAKVFKLVAALGDPAYKGVAQYAG
jgi:hypothetical protein